MHQSIYTKIINYNTCSKFHQPDVIVIHTELDSRSVPGGAKIQTKAKGRAVLHIKNNYEFFIQLDVYNIQNVTMAHIHFVNEKTPTENGPILLWLYKTKEPLKMFNGSLVSRSFTLADLQKRMNFTEFKNYIHNCKLYYNVHTVQNPNGELAGEL
jgi:hypothetical protein